MLNLSNGNKRDLYKLGHTWQNPPIQFIRHEAGEQQPAAQFSWNMMTLRKNDGSEVEMLAGSR